MDLLAHACGFDTEKCPCFVWEGVPRYMMNLHLLHCNWDSRDGDGRRTNQFQVRAGEGVDLGEPEPAFPQDKNVHLS